MKKPVAFIIIALVCCCRLFAQHPAPRQKVRSPNDLTDMVFFTYVLPHTDYSTLDIRPVAVPKQSVEIVFKEKYDRYVPQSPVRLGVRLDMKIVDVIQSQVNSFSKVYTSYNIYNNTPTDVVAIGIDSDNVKDYRYHIVVNDSAEIVPWSVPPLSKAWGSKHKHAFWPGLYQPGKQLMIEVMKLNDYNSRTGVIINWGYRQDPMIGGMSVDIPFSNVKLRPYDKSMLFASHYRPGTNIPTDLSLPIGNTGDVHVQLISHEQVPYEVSLKKNINGKLSEDKLQWWLLTDEFAIPAKEFAEPGKYDLVISAIPGINKKSTHVLDVPFIAYEPPAIKKEPTLKQALPYIIGIFTIGGVLFAIYYRRNKVKTLRISQQRQTTGLKLRSIRAQLNPHFMFNALTSIQNLVNKNDISGANHYLSIFAGITRRVLDTGNEELMSLDDELKILDDYLQMEQLRFGFTYKITIDEAINKENAEVPAMLLQPFVENAVKHGVSGLAKDGHITIDVRQEKSDLVFYIVDNGSGFAKEILAEKQASYGLKLSEERVALLNEMYKDKPFSLHIDSPSNGTIVTIRLAKWL
jgi:two-component system, LytTR family, sensor kinase